MGSGPAEVSKKMQNPSHTHAPAGWLDDVVTSSFPFTDIFPGAEPSNPAGFTHADVLALTAPGEAPYSYDRMAAPRGATAGRKMQEEQGGSAAGERAAAVSCLARSGVSRPTTGVRSSTVFCSATSDEWMLPTFCSCGSRMTGAFCPVRTGLQMGHGRALRVALPVQRFHG